MNARDDESRAPLRAGSVDRIALLTYHSLDHTGSVISVTPEAFAAQMDELERLGMRGVSLREAVAHRDRHGGWPQACVVLTFDDSYANVYEAAWPIVRCHGFTATVFVVTGHVGGCNDWSAPPARLGLQAMMSWEQLGDLAAQGIEIGSHTRRHADLRRLSTPETEVEVRQSREDIEARLNVAAESFAYPFGVYTQFARKLVGERYRAAVTTVLKRAAEEPLHALPRVDMYYVRSVDDLRRIATGQRDLYLTVRRWGRRLAQVVRGDAAVDSPEAFLPSAGKR